MTKKKRRKTTKKKSAGDKLNPLQRKFGKLYASDKEFFGNGVQAYAKAYGIDLRTRGAYQSAKSVASRLLTNVNLLAYINELLEVVLNEAHVDKQLAFLITQNADFGAKLGAIREFNSIRKRITRKIEGTLTLAQAIHQAMTDKSPE
ncbi:MAG: terminase small subunit [Planctomycetota bacterium]|jgi:hypothetical protein